MKAKLVKTENGYGLEDCDIIAFYSKNRPVHNHYKLSKENCDEIFGIVDVEKWAKEHVDEDPNLEINTSEYHNAQVDFKAGFNKAMELNKDKVFTVEDMKECFNAEMDGWVSFQAYMEDFQQPTEIEVEIVTHVDLAATPTDSRHPDAYLGVDTGIPYLDKDGCLILKKKI